MTGVDVFRAYLERFTSGDVEGAAELLADDFTFRGPMVQTDSKAEFLASTTPVAAVARGVKVHHAWADGDDVWHIVLADGRELHRVHFSDSGVEGTWARPEE